MLRWVVLAAALAFGACTSFDAIDRGVCGNGLIEPGEDCDSGDPSCVRCAVVCTTAADCPNASYACGVDGLCHAPGGALAGAVPAGAFQVNDVMITDVDRDGMGDAVGVSRTSIAVHYGDSSGRLDRATSLVTGSQLAAPAFGDLDGDGSTDVTVATLDGLVAYGSPFGSLVPLPVRSSILDQGTTELDLRHIVQLGTFLDALFISVNNVILVGVFDFYTGESSFAQPCMSRLGAVPASAFAAANVDVYAISSSDAVVAMVLDTMPRKLCVLALHKPVLGAWTVTDVTPANAPGLARRAVLADLDTDSDPCPGIVNSDGGGDALRYWDGRMTASGCTVDAVAAPAGTPLPAASTATTVAVGRVALQPTFPSFASDLLVLTDGVYGLIPGGGTPTFYRLYESLRPLASAQSVDLDRDGSVDAVLTAAGEDDIDVLYRRPNALFPFIPGYIVVRIDTDSRVLMTAIGDYDGNGLADVAMVEQLTDYQRLSVAYAGATFLDDPVEMATFPSVLTIATARFSSSEDIATATDDLIALGPPSPGRTAATATLFVGSALGQLIPTFDPRPDADQFPAIPGEQSERAMTRWAGAFVAGAAAGSPGTLFAFAVDSGGVARPGGARAPQVWRMPGTTSGPDATTTDALQTTGLADLRIDDAAYLQWPIEGGQSVVLAVDRASPPHAARLTAGTTIAATALPMITSALPASADARALYARDLDGDGAPELVIAAPTRTAQGTSALVVCTMSAETPERCDNLMPAIEDAIAATGSPATACLDGAPARISEAGPFEEPTTRHDLVVVCREGQGSVLYRVRHGDALEVRLLARSQTRLTRVHVGDVTGDGLDDVLALEGESGARSLVVFRQCSSRDTAVCNRSGGGS